MIDKMKTTFETKKIAALQGGARMKSEEIINIVEAIRQDEIMEVGDAVDFSYEEKDVEDGKYEATIRVKVAVGFIALSRLAKIAGGFNRVAAYFHNNTLSLYWSGLVDLNETMTFIKEQEQN